MTKQLSEINQLKNEYRTTRKNRYQQFWARQREEYGRDRQALAARRAGIPGPPAAQRVRLFRYL